MYVFGDKSGTSSPEKSGLSSTSLWYSEQVSSCLHKLSRRSGVEGLAACSVVSDDSGLLTPAVVGLPQISEAYG